MATRIAAAALLAPLLTSCGYWGALQDARQDQARQPVVIQVDPADAPQGVVTYLTARKNPADGGSTDGGVRIRTAQDTAKLVGAPDDLRGFLGWRVRASVAIVNDHLAARGEKLPADCDVAARITVWGVGNGVATGREWWCNRVANEVIWVKKGDSWRVAARMRGGWECSVLRRYRIPPEIAAAVCWADDGMTERIYR